MNRDMPLEFRLDGFADTEVPVIGVDAFHDRPGCCRAVGPCDDLFRGVDEGIVMFVVAPVLVLDLVAQHGIGR